MKRCLAACLILMMMMPAALAETGMYLSAGPEETHALLAEPDKRSEVLGQYYPGTPVTILEEDSYWRRVRIGDQVGWMVINYLSDTPAWMVGPLASVVNEDSDWVNLREGATTKSASLARVKEYDKVLVLGCTADGWTYVDWQNRRGFILSRFLDVQPDSINTTVVGRAGEGYIHQYAADNEQVVSFVAQEKSPRVAYEDVNFDGAKDIVVVTAQGPYNASKEFFVWDGGQYVLAGHPGADSLVGTFLHPAQGMISCEAWEDYTGMMFDNRLFRWEGNDLVLVRRAVSERLTETAADEEKTTVTTWNNILHVRVWAYPDGPEEGVIIHEERVPLTSETDFGFTQRINDILWQGIE